jgi:hypothetical protein
MTKTIDTLRKEAAEAEAFAKWAAKADDDEAPAQLYYPKPTGKGVWSWQAKAEYDAQQAAAALKAAEAAEAAKPLEPAEPSDDEELPRYVAPPEAPEVTAARLARYAADGRSPTGVLVNQLFCTPVALASKPEAGYWLARQSQHTAAECQAIVQLWGPQLGADLILYDNCGWDLDDLYGVEMQTAHEQWVAACHAVEHITRAEDQRRIAEAWRKAVVETAQQEARSRLKRDEAVQKCGRICTRCYSCEGNKHTDWEDGGKKARPSTLHVSSECFTHAEFLAGRIREDCPFLHTGDAGWHAEWDTNLLWDPMHPEVMPVPKHIRKREGDAALCISEKSAGYLPLHLGGKVDGMDARQWRNSAPAQNRFSSLAAGGSTAAPAPKPKAPWGK